MWRQRIERLISHLADANVMFGMPPSMIELIVMEERERAEAERRNAAEIEELERLFNATPR